jgi:hypothetical protein
MKSKIRGRRSLGSRDKRPLKRGSEARGVTSWRSPFQGNLDTTA